MHNNIIYYYFIRKSSLTAISAIREALLPPQHSRRTKYQRGGRGNPAVRSRTRPVGESRCRHWRPGPLLRSPDLAQYWYSSIDAHYSSRATNGRRDATRRQSYRVAPAAIAVEWRDRRSGVGPTRPTNPAIVPLPGHSRRLLCCGVVGSVARYPPRATIGHREYERRLRNITHHAAPRHSSKRSVRGRWCTGTRASSPAPSGPAADHASPSPLRLLPPLLAAMLAATLQRGSTT